METKGEAPSLVRNSNVEDDAGWSGGELDDAPLSQTRAERRKPILSEEEMGKAAVFLTIIILGFAAAGLSLSHFFPSKQSAAFANCVRIARNSERLSCYDRAANNATAPFKGGSPFSAYSHSGFETFGPG